MCSQLCAFQSESQGRRLLETFPVGQKRWESLCEWLLLRRSPLGAIAASTARAFPGQALGFFRSAQTSAWKSQRLFFLYLISSFITHRRFSLQASAERVFCKQNGTQFAQCWCKHQPQIISACGQLIISLVPGGNVPRHFCSSEAVTFALYLHWMFKYFCIPVTVSSTSSYKFYTCFG